MFGTEAHTGIQLGRLCSSAHLLRARRDHRRPGRRHGQHAVDLPHAELYTMLLGHALRHNLPHAPTAAPYPNPGPTDAASVEAVLRAAW